jgi:hypothetical protein
MDLNSIMEFDHPVRVHADGTVTDAGPDFWAPETDVDTDGNGSILAEHEQALCESVKRQGWSLYTTGYTQQYSYRGPIMHTSEFIGGRLAMDILADPGVYVSVVVSTDENGDDNVAGWAVAKKDGTTNVADEDSRWWGSIECDGYFLIVDTAVHHGWDVDVDELVAHVNECETCRDQDNTVSLTAFGMLTEK